MVVRLQSCDSHVTNTCINQFLYLLWQRVLWQSFIKHLLLLMARYGYWSVMLLPVQITTHRGKGGVAQSHWTPTVLTVWLASVWKAVPYSSPASSPFHLVHEYLALEPNEMIQSQI